MSDNKKSTQWTESQTDAIHKNGCQLLVAAGAGSGKTSVLTERILTKILQGSDIDSFLVVTFTVASAEDMKEKLRKKLLEKYAEDTGNGHLSSQIAKLPFAQISTITSFCLKLVKQNFSLLNLPAGVRIADEGEAEELFESAMDLLLDERFEENDPSLHKLLQFSACRDNENRLSEYLSEAYKKLRAHPHYLKKLDEVTKDFSAYAEGCSSISDALKGKYGKFICDSIEYIISLPFDELDIMKEIGESGGEKLSEITDSYISFFKAAANAAGENRFLESARAYNDAHDFCTNGWRKGKPYENLDKEEKKAYDELKSSTRDKAKKASEFFYELDEYFLGDTKICSELMYALKDMLTGLDKTYALIKKEKGVLDFTDAEQLAHTLLIDESSTPTTLCEEISASLEEVLVDEYQDTNPLQDSIFSAIATKDNRFMVGDDKQSIYRFRNAYPDIFNNYKKSFNTPKSACIFLRENFRCSKEIIDFTNSVFDFLWGEDYKKESLIFAKKSEKENHEKVTVKTFITDLKNKESSVYEARYIADEILRLKESYIKENGEPLGFSDIAVLLPVAKNVTDIFIDEFRKKGVPVTSKKQGLLINAPEIKLMISILRAINNPEEDVPLASAMNSFFFGFTADELAKIREFKDTSLWGSVHACCKNIRIFPKQKLKSKRKVKSASIKSIKLRKKTSDSLKSKCREFVKTLNLLREKARSMECKQLIWDLLENNGIFDEIEAEIDGEIKKGNLLLLYTEAIAYGRKEYKTLSAFLKHAENLTTQTYSPEGADSVSVMTIHASKGLEFPVCFLANAGKNLQGGSKTKMPVFNTNYGMFVPLRHEDFSTRESAFYKACEITEKPAELAENQRKLYVALTRAREKLYIVGSSAEKYSLRNASPTDGKNYLNWILTSKPDGEYFEEELVCQEDDSQPQEDKISKEIIPEIIDYERDEVFVYPYKDSISIPRKLSVSELKESSKDEYIQSIRKKNFLTVPAFAAETKKVSPTEIGTANHTFMQFASFENCIKFGVEYEAQRLLLTDMITDEQYGMLNFKSIKLFFKSSLWEKIKKSPKVYREKRFTVLDNSSDLLGEGNETVLVQGVIDLFFENDDGTYTVVDYKTDSIRAGDEDILITRYKGQISYYAKAVKGITGKDVSDGIIYSFSSGKEIPVKIN